MIGATDSGKGNEALRSTRFTAGNGLADAPDETTDQRLKAEVLYRRGGRHPGPLRNP